ncbi:hypothetical protein ACGYLO_21705 [Sulfitobacter sp. 1A13353]|uniref:hypothetical protein n=1 Tax=Sulfitobacter sp. 1A13353 TaxID=3368568 RepID=UPI003745A356
MTAEHHRTLAMQAIYRINTWKKCWPVWEVELDKRSASFSNPKLVHDLGSHLREVFFATNTGARGQADLSGGGAGWECLVTWYLNLILSGTNAVAVRQSKAVMPETLLDATTIRYGTHQTNTESDVCVIVYPADFKFPAPDAKFMFDLNDQVEKRIGDIELGIIQCKTNWNDNAQIPMLWDMVYRASFGSETNIHIGKRGYNVKHLKRFSYSFVTVPSQKDSLKKKSIPNSSTQMAVKRVSGLSGGNYWGMPTKSGVALSVSEIFDSNFSNAFKVNVRASVGNAIVNKLGMFSP